MRRKRTRCVRAVWLALGLCLAAEPGFAFQSYFVNREVQADTLELFPKWTGMLARFRAEAKTLDSVCSGSALYAPCRLKTWKDFLIGLDGASEKDQLDAVNRFVNKYPFAEDIVTWGIPDYWATPYEVQRRNAADCEDYAIAKYISLRALGVSEETMRVTVVRDMNLGNIVHAVLVVKRDGESFVLDNQIKQVLPATKIYHYVPVYGINETHWWQYFMPAS